jgi:hypothetical protein
MARPIRATKIWQAIGKCLEEDGIATPATLSIWTTRPTTTAQQGR